jgi:hypothetical protein
MARFFLTNIDLQNNQLVNFVVEKLASDPSTPIVGRLVYNTTSNKLEYWNGTAWVLLDNASAAYAADSDKLDAQHGAYYLARANHSGTQLASSVSDFDTQVRTSRLDQMAIPTAALNLNSQKITSLAAPTAATDAATKAYSEARSNHTGTQLAATISDFDTQVRTSRLDQMAIPTAALNLNSQKITSLATPTAGTDAATKAYADGLLTGTGYSANVGNGTLTTITVTHNLGTRDILVNVWQSSTPWARIECDIVADTINSIQLTFSSAPASNAYRVCIKKA